MLQIRNIRKEYVTGDLRQVALDDVSLNLRDSEFVAILGPSGSGKTTLLNIIGGLDRYDSGDLIINGVSTKRYKDRDWDSYRNHSIGFVFQSYNLIPHQTVLSNVELALTISGVSPAERRRRAAEALEKVGLGDQMHKRPNQMSGGQMQRVAIARAMVNDPDILLADEPTGALDTKTSVQIMELLKEVARDRLVVMVTHNPELAAQYATRIVDLRDGAIVGDTDPFEPEPGEEPAHRNLGRAGMSFLTALKLSGNNLRTKKGRTLLTAFAGSIGIIGIALILSLSNGARVYIRDVEQQTLSLYPLTIGSTGTDLAALLQGGFGQEEEEEPEGEVTEERTVERMLSRVSFNDLRSFREYLESDECPVYEYANAVEYTYNVTPRIYRITDPEEEPAASQPEEAEAADAADDDAETPEAADDAAEAADAPAVRYRQVHPDATSSSMSAYARSAPMFAAFSGGRDVFHALPENSSLYMDQYDVMAGRWPENEFELVLVLSEDSTVTDLTLYAAGLRDANELDEMMDAYAHGDEVRTVEEGGAYDYDDFLGLTFKLVNVCDLYEYDPEFGVYVDRSANTERMNRLVGDGEDLTIVGVVRPAEDATISMLSTGIAYPAQLERFVMEESAASDIVQRQLADPETDVFSGNAFDTPADRTPDLEELFSVDTAALSRAFSFNPAALQLDPAAFGLDFSSLQLDLSGMNIDPSQFTPDLGELLSGLEIEVSSEALQSLFSQVASGYLAQAASDPATDYASLGDAATAYLQSEEAAAILRDAMQQIINDAAASAAADAAADAASGGTDGAPSLPPAPAVPEITPEQARSILAALAAGYESYASANGLPELSRFRESFTSYLNSEEGRALILSGIQQVVDTESLEAQISAAVAEMMAGMSAQVQQALGSQMNSVISQLAGQLTSSISSQLIPALAGAFSFDPQAFANAIQINMDGDSLQEIMLSMMSSDSATYEGNLEQLNYANPDEPWSILIYPKTFEHKALILQMIEDYNQRMRDAGEEAKVITFTDYVGTLMTSVTDIVDTISYILIAFVAISLVVSSIMIGIITYISVLERTKEIGILRAMGASKRNISRVFNAETIIIGLLAGVIGILLALVLLIPVNALIHALAGANEISAVMPPLGALVLIGISVLLTLIGGLIPSRKASRMDPVAALRSE